MKWVKKITIGAFVCGALLTTGLYWPINFDRAQLSPSLLAKDGSLLRAYAAPDGQIRLPVTSAEVDPEFIKMLLGVEDRRFYSHPGVDPFALARASMQWAQTGHVVSGGSTITMQIARLLHPAPRNILTKFTEIWRALQLEVRFSKTQILDMYLRLAPYGGNISGIRAATLIYFNKEPMHLTPDEAALLVALPQNPNGLRPDRFPQAARKARAKVLNRLHDQELISDTALEAGLAAPIPLKKKELPKHAPHLADYLLASRREAAIWPSTLDPVIQKQAEKILSLKLESLSGKATIAALIIDNRTQNILTYIGSADYFSTARAGQIDMVRAMRSPGSTLKPFVYGLAFQDGLATPETIIRDTPIRFGNYVPSNFNRGFSGDISLRNALQQSLNIPAVKLLNEIGAERFLAKLRAGGGKFILPERKSTAELPIILGGIGTRLWDLSELYVGLANSGIIRPLHFLQNENNDKAFRLLTEEAASQVTDILTGSRLSEGVARGSTLAQLAIKTGTSFGYRDAWSIGYTRDYTIGVWVGRPDGTPIAGQIGRNTAIPILLNLYDLLPSNQTPWDTPSRMAALPDNLRRWTGDRVLRVNKKSPLSSLLIQYPVENSQFQLEEIKPHGLKLIAKGGAKPYQWYVNSIPVFQQANSRDFIWTPESSGYYKLTVQDREGRVTRASVEIAAE